MKGNEKESVQRMNMRVGVSAVAPLLPARPAAAAAVPPTEESRHNSRGRGGG